MGTAQLRQQHCCFAFAEKKNNKELTPSSRVWKPLFMEAITPTGDELITQRAKINSANRCCYWRFPGNATAANLRGTQCVRGSLVYDTSRGRKHALFVLVPQILVGSGGTGNQDVRDIKSIGCPIQLKAIAFSVSSCWNFHYGLLGRYRVWGSTQLLLALASLYNLQANLLRKPSWMMLASRSHGIFW